MKLAFVAVGLLLLSCVGFAQPTFSTGPALPAGQTGTPYSQQIVVLGGTTPYTFAITSGTLQAGLTMSSTGLISGGATAAGTANFTVTVTDSATPANVIAQAFSLTITLTPLGIATTSPLPGGFTGYAYSQTLTAVGGIPPYTWALGGSLPPGFTLTSGGVLSGLPTAVGSYSFSAMVTDSTSSNVTKPFSLSITLGALQITTLSPLPSTLADAPYSEAIAAEGGVPPYIWAVSSGTLPAGLSLSGSTGIISGTPSAPGTSTFSINVSDNNFHVVSGSFTLTIGGAAVSISTPAVLPAGTDGAAYSATLTATGGVAPYTWSVVSGTLPPGLVLSTGGVISGTPTVSGGFVFSIQVADSTSLTNSLSFSLTIAAVGSVPRTGTISQIVTGGGWITTIWLVNRTAAPVQTSLVFHADNGAALTLPVNVIQGAVSTEVAGSTLTEVIAPNTTLVVATLPQVLNVEGWVDVLGNGALSGFAFYGNGSGEASVPLQPQIGNSFTLPFDNTGGNSTGVAIVNLAGAQAAITATVWDQNGNPLLTSVAVALTETDPGGDGHDSFMLPARIPVTAGRKGIIQFVGNPASSSVPAGQVTGLGLRTDSTGLFTTIQTIIP